MGKRIAGPAESGKLSRSDPAQRLKHWMNISATSVLASWISPFRIMVHHLGPLPGVHFHEFVRLPAMHSLLQLVGQKEVDLLVGETRGGVDRGQPGQHVGASCRSPPPAPAGRRWTGSRPGSSRPAGISQINRRPHGGTGGSGGSGDRRRGARPGMEPRPRRRDAGPSPAGRWIRRENAPCRGPD